MNTRTLKVATMALLATALLAVAAPRLAHAGPPNIAICRPSKAIFDCQQFKDMSEALKRDTEQINSDAEKRKADLKQAKEQRDLLIVGSTQYNEQNDKLLQSSIEYNVWAQLYQQDLERRAKANQLAMYKKLLEAVKAVAQQKGINLVIADTKATDDLDKIDLDKLDLDTLGRVLQANNVLYADAGLDITGDVVVWLDKQYVAGNH